jgi:hypothetical protein
MPAWGTSSLRNGWNWDSANTRLDFGYRGTRVGHLDTSGLTLAGNMVVSDSQFIYFGTGSDVSFTHDGTSFITDFPVATDEWVINEASEDTNFRVEGDNDINMIHVDAGNDSLGFGTTGTANGFITILPGGQTLTAVNLNGSVIHMPTDTLNYSNASSTVATFSGITIPVFTLTGDNATLTFTNAATMVLRGAPAAGSNVAITNPALALWVDAGTVRLDGPLHAASDGEGSDGEQLTSGGTGAVMDWSAASCIKDSKTDIELWKDPQDALDAILKTNIYNFHYKSKWDGGVRHPSTGDVDTLYTGPMADEAPWAMHQKGSIINPINTFGYTALAFKAMQAKIDALTTRVEELQSA